MSNSKATANRSPFLVISLAAIRATAMNRIIVPRFRSSLSVNNPVTCRVDVKSFGKAMQSRELSAVCFPDSSQENRVRGCTCECRWIAFLRLPLAPGPYLSFSSQSRINLNLSRSQEQVISCDPTSFASKRDFGRRYLDFIVPRRVRRAPVIVLENSRRTRPRLHQS